METNRKEYIRECLKKYYQSPKYKKSSKEITKKLSKGKGQVYEWNEAEGTFKKSTLNLEMETEDLREFKQRLSDCVNKHRIEEKKYQLIEHYKRGYLDALNDIMSDLGLTDEGKNGKENREQ